MSNPELAKTNAVKISRLVTEAHDLLRQAEKLADEAGIGFSFDVEYGMGGYYEEGEWHPSSMSC